MKKVLCELWAEKRMLFGLFVVWFAPSCALAVVGHPDLFAAMGSVGVVASIYFASSTLETMRKAIRVERDAQIDDRISRVHNDVTLEVIRRRLLEEPENEQLMVLQSSVQANQTQIIQRINQKENAGINQKYRYHEYVLVRFELTVLCVSTLQWGFGAMVVS